MRRRPLIARYYQPATRRDYFNLLVVVGSLIAAAVLLLLAMLGCARAEAQPVQPTITLPPGAYTDCGKLGARHTINLASKDPVVRWGYCAGNRADTDNCNVNRTSGRDRRARCAGEEYEIGQYYEALSYRTYGCNPPGGLPPLQAEAYNYQDIVLAVDVMLDLQCERCRACGLSCIQCPGARPTPTPAPTASPLPTGTPRPTPTPTPPVPVATPCPSSTPCAACPPLVVCAVYALVDEPPEVRDTIEAGLGRLGRQWRERVTRAQAWRAAHPGPHYSLISSSRISQTIEPWDCAPDQPLCEQDKQAVRERYPWVTREELP